MGFSVVSPNAQTIWMPVDYAGTVGDTLYVGQIVCTTGDGVAPLGAAAGIGDTTDKRGVTVVKHPPGVPFGVVVATNNKEPVFNATYSADSITSESGDTHASFTRTRAGHDGVGVPKNDKIAMVKIALIDATTLIRGPIYNATYGTALTEVSCSTGNTSGVGFIAPAGGGWGCTATSDFRTVYCRTGLNAGMYRISDDATSSALTFDAPWPYDIAAGDKFVAVNLRRGTSIAQFDSESMCILQSAGLTNFYYIDVLYMDLSKSGQEYAVFRFNPYQLTAYDNVAT